VTVQMGFVCIQSLYVLCNMRLGVRQLDETSEVGRPSVGSLQQGESLRLNEESNTV
jgi:hypothetical protein